MANLTHILRIDVHADVEVLVLKLQLALTVWATGWAVEGSRDDRYP